jgi:hypothetical protein
VAKKPSKHGRSWSTSDISTLKRLARENTPTRVIGLKLNRTDGAVRSKASELDISLKPTNQSPYGRVTEKGRGLKKKPKPPAPPRPRKGTRSTGPRARAR